MAEPEQVPTPEPTGPSPAPPPPPPAAARRGLPVTTVSWVLAAINVLVWLAMEAMGGSTSGRVLIAFGAKVNSLIAHGEYWRLFTPMFLHVGLVHLLFNTFALLSFGRMAEGIYGHARFLAIYLVSGVSGALFSYLMSPNPSAGASGAIFGVAGALAVFFAVNRRASPITGQGQLSGILLLLVVNGVWGVLQPVIDNWGHLGGLVAGVILGLALTPRLTLLWSPEGELVGFRRQESPPVRWLIVPLLLLLIAAAVRFIQGR